MEDKRVVEAIDLLTEVKCVLAAIVSFGYIKKTEPAYDIVDELIKKINSFKDTRNGGK